jgi:hypothetical protein
VTRSEEAGQDKKPLLFQRGPIPSPEQWAWGKEKKELWAVVPWVLSKQWLGLGRFQATRTTIENSHNNDKQLDANRNY